MKIKICKLHRLVFVCAAALFCLICAHAGAEEANKGVVEQIGETYTFDNLEKLEQNKNMGGTTDYTLETEDGVNKYALSKSSNTIYQLWPFTDIGELMSYGAGALSDDEKGIRISFKVKVNNKYSSNNISVFPMHKAENGIRLFNMSYMGRIYVGNSAKKAIPDVRCSSGVWYDFIADINLKNKTVTGRILNDGKWYSSEAVDLSGDDIVWSYEQGGTRTLSSFRLYTADKVRGIGIDDVSFYKINMCRVSVAATGDEAVSGAGAYMPGDVIKITAKSDNPDKVFDGWYVNGEKVSDDEEMQITVSDDVQYESRYIDINENSGMIGETHTYESLDKLVQNGTIGGTTTYTLEIEDDNKYVRSKSNNIDFQLNPYTSTGGLWTYGNSIISDKTKGMRTSFRFRAGDLSKSNFISIFPMHKGRNAAKLISTDSNGNVWVGDKAKKKISSPGIQAGVWYDYSVDINYALKQAVGRIKIDDVWYYSDIVDLSGDSIVWSYNQNGNRYFSSMQLNTTDTVTGLDIDDISFYKVDMYEFKTEADGIGAVTGGGMAAKGTKLFLNASVIAGSVFDGWYNENGTKIAGNSAHSLYVSGNGGYTGRFHLEEGILKAKFDYDPISINGNAVHNIEDFIPGAAASVSVNYENTLSEDGGYMLITSYYKDEKLAGVQINNVKHDKTVITNNDKISFTAGNSDDCDYMKIMVWDNDMKALDDALKIRKKVSEYAKFTWDVFGTENCFVREYSEGSHHNKVFDGERTIAVGAGSNGWTRVIIDVDDDAFPQNVPTPVAVTVRYWDDYTEGSDSSVKANSKWLCLRYATSEGAWKDSTPLYIGDSKTFKEHTWYIDDFVFSNSMNSSDLWLVSWTPNYRRSGSPMYAASVEIRKTEPSVPVKINGFAERWDGDQYGNMFSGEDDKIINLKAISLIEEAAEIAGTYEVYTTNGVFVESGSIPKTSVGAKEEVQIPVRLNVSRYGCYEIRFNTVVSYVGGEVICNVESAEDFSVVNKLKENEKKNPIVRICGHSAGSQANGQYWKQVMNTAASIGVSGLRETIEWETIEPVQGRYNSWAGASHYEYAKTVGIDNMLGMLVGHRSWGKADWSFPQTENEISMTENFVDWLFKNYGGDIPYIEYWNEPNLGNFNATKTTPEEYVEIMKRIYPKVKGNNPDTVVNAFSLAQIDNTFLTRGLEAGLLDYCDSIGIHLYDSTAFNQNKDLRDQVFIDDCTRLRESFAKYNHPETRLDITELGIKNVSPDEQGAGAAQMYALAQFTGCADSIYYYDYVNDNTKDRAASNWGWLYNFQDRTPLAAKPGYVAMGAYNHFLSDAVPVDSYVSGDKLTRAYRFRRNADGKDVVMLWTDGASDSVSLDLGAEVCEIFDMYSNKKGILSSQSGVYDFITSFEPIYIVGSFTKNQYVSPGLEINNGRPSAKAGDEVSFIIKDNTHGGISVKAIAQDKLTLKSIEALGDGSVSVTVKCLEASKTNRVSLDIYSGDKLITSANVHVEITE